MTTFAPAPFLRTVFFLDAATCVAFGLLLTCGGAPLTGLTGLPAALHWYAGLSLWPFAAYLVFLATRARLTVPMVGAAIGLNVIWAVDGFAMLMGGWVQPTALGTAPVSSSASQ